MVSLSIAAAGSAGRPVRRQAQRSSPRGISRQGAKRGCDQEEVRRTDHHVRRRLGRQAHTRDRPRGEVLEGHRDQGQVVPHPADSERFVFPAGADILVELVGVRRGDDRRRLARVPSRRLVNLKRELRKEASSIRRGSSSTTPSAESSSRCRGSATSGSSTTATDLLTKYDYSGPPKTWAQLCAMAQEDPGRRASEQPELRRVRLPGQRVRGTHVQRARVARDVRRRALHRRRQGHDQQPAGGGDPQPPAKLGRQDHAARRDHVPGRETENAFIAERSVRTQLAIPVRVGQRRRPVKGKFDVAPLSADGANSPVGTVGGWQLGVSKYSKHSGRRRVRPLHDQPGGREVQRDHQQQRPDHSGVADLPAVRKVNPCSSPRSQTCSASRAPRASSARSTTRAPRSSTRASTRSSTGTTRQSVLPGVAQRLERVLP